MSERPRLRIGLTGGIASGKSTVSERFKELRIAVIDADVAARAVVAPGSMGLSRVVARFGPQMLDPKGELDRRALRAAIFKDDVARRDLNAILHPLIRAHMDLAVSTAGGAYIVLAIPLLIEGGAPRDRVDRVLVVDVAEATQIERVIRRDGSSHAEATAIVKSQASRQARLDAADDVLVNTGSVAELRQAVDALHERYLKMAGATPQFPI